MTMCGCTHAMLPGIEPESKDPQPDVLGLAARLCAPGVWSGPERGPEQESEHTSEGHNHDTCTTAAGHRSTL